MTNANANVKKHCGAVYYAVTSVGMVLAVIADVIYWCIPESELANGIEHSGKEAVYALAIAPVLACIALIIYVAGSLIDKVIVRNSVVQRVIFGISVVSLLVTAGVTLAFTVFSNSLGFVAPVGSTVWFGLGIFSSVATLIYIGANIYIFFTGKKN